VGVAALVSDRAAQRTGEMQLLSALSQCASGPDNFYMLTSANQVISALNSIETSLSKLRVAK
jgi:hypothetical protein